MRGERHSGTIVRLGGLLAALLVLGISPAGTAAAPPGPLIAKCGKLKQGLGKLGKAQKRKAQQRFKACQKQNKANRVAFNQIKDSQFVGVRGDGAGVNDTYCANGRFESRSTDSYGTGVSSGSRWWVKDAVVRQGGKWIDAFVGAPGGFEVALSRRGSQWQYGIASLGRILDPGDVAKTAAGSSPVCTA